MSQKQLNLFRIWAVLIFGLLISIQILYASDSNNNGFNIIKNNQLEFTGYTFDDFLNDYKEDHVFVCIDNRDWKIPKEEIRYVLKEKNSDFGKECRFEYLTKIVNGERITDSTKYFVITEDNFPNFREDFISGECLKYQSSFPVKFLKVKTQDRLREINFTSLPGDEKTIENANVDNVIYYAYKNRVVGDDRYVYLGINPKFITTSERDIREILVGWVRYKKDGKKVNAVLWNTTLGFSPKSIRDKDITRRPYVFFKNKAFTAQKYATQGIIPDKDNLLIDSRGLRSYESEYEKKKQTFRWLPMYDVSKFSNPTSVRVGIIDSTNRVRQDIIELVRMRKLQIALLIDASKSMTQVWNNLDQILIQTLNSIVTKNFVNIAGKKIELEIKIYYYTDSLHLLNEDKFISSIEDVKEYRIKINSISDNLAWTSTYLPKIYQSIAKVYEELGDKPLYTIVIGDVGDNDYSINFSKIPEIKKQNTKNLSPIFGIRFNSQFYHGSSFFNNIEIPNFITKKRHATGLNRFSTNFGEIDKNGNNTGLLADIPDGRIDSDEISTISDKITSKITKSIDNIIQKLKDEILIVQDKNTETAKKSYEGTSLFSERYIRSVSEKLEVNKGISGVGTYFEEGIMIKEDNEGNSLCNKDIMIEKKQVRNVVDAIQGFKNNTTDSEFQLMIRKLLSTFFEIDFTEVDQKFLQETTLFDFWATVVGDPKVAKKIVPTLFMRKNVNFATINDQWYDFRDQIRDNVSKIENKLVHDQIDENIGLYRTMKKVGDSKEYADYYWVNVNDIRFFEGINFDIIK